VGDGLSKWGSVSTSPQTRKGQALEHRGEGIVDKSSRRGFRGHVTSPTLQKVELNSTTIQVAVDARGNKQMWNKNLTSDVRGGKNGLNQLYERHNHFGTFVKQGHIKPRNKEETASTGPIGGGAYRSLRLEKETQGTRQRVQEKGTSKETGTTYNGAAMEKNDGRGHPLRRGAKRRGRMVEKGGESKFNHPGGSKSPLYP